jgi:hypothetical protein
MKSKTSVRKTQTTQGILQRLYKHFVGYILNTEHHNSPLKSVAEAIWVSIAVVYIPETFRLFFALESSGEKIVITAELLDRILTADKNKFARYLRKQSGLTTAQSKIAENALKHSLLYSDVFSKPVKLVSDGKELTFSK